MAVKRRDFARLIEVARSKLQPQYTSIERVNINVLVDATAEADLELELTYSVTGASWSPLYDIRLVENNVSVGYLANVQQATGEDWPAVRLALSTAHPVVTNNLPWPASVTVEDQYPVSRNEQIKSTLQTVTPQPAKKAYMNSLKWVTELAPARKQDFSFSFQIEQPRDMKITGIDA